LSKLFSLCVCWLYNFQPGYGPPAGFPPASYMTSQPPAASYPAMGYPTSQPPAASYPAMGYPSTASYPAAPAPVGGAAGMHHASVPVVMV
jgi:hypothetical protein